MRALPTTIQKPWASPEIVDQVIRYGRAEEPNEACGIITPDSVVMKLPNSSQSPTTSYVIATSDLVNALNEYIERSGAHPSNLPMDCFIVWHTHPAGNIGPSRGDMESKIEGFQYLVVAMPDGEATLF